MRKIKQAERKAKETEDKIKKQSEANRRETRRAPNAFPIGMGNIPGIGPNIVVPNNLPPGISGLGPLNMGQLPPMGMGGFTAPLNMKPPIMGQGLPPGVPSGLTGIPGFPPQNPNDAIRNRIKNIIKDKASFLNSNQ